MILAGKEYGSGSSRDWAAKGTVLLGVHAVIAESYERIHRSNLIGMGVLPLQFPDGQSADSLGLTGEETVRRSPASTRSTTADPATPCTSTAGGSRSSTRSCASTPPARPTTTATAASCSTCCGNCSATNPPLPNPDDGVRQEEAPWPRRCITPTTPEIQKLRKELVPHTHDAFEAFSHAVFAEGALPEKTKQLIAVAVAHTTQCPYCIQGHTKLAHRKGASDQEIMEAIWVAAEMRAGGAYAHATLAFEVLDK